MWNFYVRLGKMKEGFSVRPRSNIHQSIKLLLLHRLIGFTPWPRDNFQAVIETLIKSSNEFNTNSLWSTLIIDIIHRWPGIHDPNPDSGMPRQPGMLTLG